VAGEANQNPPVNVEPTAGGNKTDSRIESDAPATSSSATMAAIKMTDKKISEIYDYWNKSNVSKANRQTYHDFGWLMGNLISSIPEVDFLPPTTPPWFASNPIWSLG
jgi:hypothetical protein